MFLLDAFENRIFVILYNNSTKYCFTSLNKVKWK